MKLRFSNFILFFWLTLEAEAVIVNLLPTSPLQNIGLTASESQLAEITLRLYTGKTVDEYTSVLIDNAADLLEKMNGSRPTVLYISGWSETPDNGSATTIVPAYLARQDHNVIVVDWQKIASETYFFAAMSASGVGSKIAKGLNELVGAGLNSSNLDIVSHSLGSPIAGFVGRNVNFRVSRITGLDPAGPGFNIVIENLDSKDAEFVAVIHTDGGFYGTADAKGTVDFYPNGGIRGQPGCPATRSPLSKEDFCDHHRSYEYFAESLRNAGAFVGLKCDSYTSFGLGFCSSNSQVEMGYATSPSAEGKYYLTTNGKTPYGRGARGTMSSSVRSPAKQILKWF